MLYTKQKKDGKGTAFLADKAAKRVIQKLAKAITGASQKTTFRIKKSVGKAIKEYPKSAAALGGAIGFDIFDDD